MKILLVNFGAFGDILNSTPIAKHYKLVDPSCHITWMTREKYKSVIKNNPYIDNILTPKESHLGLEKAGGAANVHMTFLLRDEILKLNYDKIFFVAPYTWTLTNKEFDVNKHTLLDVIKTKVSDINDFACDFIPVINLSEEEKKEAKSFFDSLNGNKKILIEYENFSNQSPFNEKYIDKLCEFANNKNYDLIFSGKQEPEFVKSLKQKYNVNFHMYNGSFMSNAELYNLCDMFIGCCSGITCLTHSDYCDTNKNRLEVTRGKHWSSYQWVHMINKNICHSLEQYSQYLKGI
jgi:ADP-heptose:LPS heptosyltransferase